MKTPETAVNPDDSNEKEYKSRSLRRNPNLKDQKKILNEDEDWTTVGQAKLRNGDYVVTPAFKGVFHVRFFNFFLILITQQQTAGGYSC